MKWEITLERDPDLLRVEVFDDFTAEGYAEMLGDIARHPAWHESMNALMDYRATDSTRTDYAAIQAAVEAQERMRVEIGSGRAAVLVGDDLTYGLGRVYQSLGYGRYETDIAVFRDESRARGWLRGDDEG